jgi:hypothetical protein
MNNDDQEVGYRKPPKATQFQKGQSGNKAGRPKGARNLNSVFADELNEKVSINENGSRKTVSKQQIVVKRIVNNAAAGDPRHGKIVLSQIAEIEAKAEAFSGMSDGLSETDAKILHTLYTRMQAISEASP